MEAQAHEGEQAKAVAVDVAMLHPLAQVFQSDLDQKSANDPKSRMPIGHKRFWKQVEKTEAQQKCAPKGEQQGQVFLHALPHGFAQACAQQCDEEQGTLPS